MKDWIDLAEIFGLRDQEAVEFIIRKQQQKAREEQQEETNRRREGTVLRREEEERVAEFSDVKNGTTSSSLQDVTLSAEEMKLTAEGMQSDHMGKFQSCQL